MNKTQTHNIVLIGPMGTGKSTIGKKLSRQLNKQFIDSDNAIEESTGVSIATIFEYEGEDGFRKREKKFIEEITTSQNMILATGGGTILDPENRQRLKTFGHVIYLHASLKCLLARTTHDRKRPLLQTDDPEGTLKNLISKRQPLYDSIAELSIDTSKQSVKVITDQIIAYIANLQTDKNENSNR